MKPINEITLSDNAARIAGSLGARSKLGLAYDPWVKVDDLVDELEIDDDTLEAAVADLTQHGFVAIDDDACHRLPFRAIAPLPPLFWWADPAIHGWNPIADAKAVAAARLALGERSAFVPVETINAKIEWSPRRINPAVAYLVQNQQVREIHHLGGGPHGGYALLATGATRLAVSTLAQPAPQGIYAVMFTDVVGSTSLAREIGDGPARIVLGRHDQVIKVTVQSKGGRIVKGTGDGFYVVFSAIQTCLDAALAIQVALARLNREYPDHPVSIRVALDAGELRAEGEDFYGLAVNRAARILGRAGANGIAASAAIAELAEGYDLVPIGPQELKDFGTVELYQLNGRLQTDRASDQDGSPPSAPRD